MDEHHWGYGSGLVGCLYDNGPHFVETKAQAIDGVLCIFGECSEEMIAELRSDLEACADAPKAGETVYIWPKERAMAGADLLEIWRVEGPCPESED